MLPLETSVSDPGDPPATCPSFLDIFYAPTTSTRFLFLESNFFMKPLNYIYSCTFYTICENKLFVPNIDIVSMCLNM